MDRASADVLEHARAEREERAKTARVLLEALIDAQACRTDTTRHLYGPKTKEEIDLYFLWSDATVRVMVGLESELEHAIRALR